MSNRYKGGVLSATPPTTSSSAAPGIWTLEQQMQATAGTGWPFGGPFTYIEDVFSTWLYTGNGTSQTITNGINLSANGGLVWTKDRNNGANHQLFDTARGLYKRLATNSTAAEFNYSPDGLTAFNSNGFTMTGNGDYNSNGYTIASWSFREQPKFFDIVTYTGNGAAARAINHSLGSVPGCMIVKSVSEAGNWRVYHRGCSTNNGLVLNDTGAQTTSAIYWFGDEVNVIPPTSTQFTVNAGFTNINGATYVAYLFAHNAGGFGLTGSDNVISCGSYTGIAYPTSLDVNVGFEPQWVLIKNATTASGWAMWDVMRGMAVVPAANTAQAQLLEPNTTAAESIQPGIYPTATGFVVKNGLTSISGSGDTMIYIAIRRGPMKVPTTGTSVFTPVARAGTSAVASVNTGIVTDAVWETGRSGQTNFAYDRLRGPNTEMSFTSTNGESTYTATATLTGFDSMTGFTVGADASSYINGSGINYINWAFQRAPGFFDEVCYTGTGSATTFSHNLGVTPELMLVKRRDSLGAWNVWNTYIAGLNAANLLELNAVDAVTPVSTAFNSTSPTSSVFTVGTAGRTNASGGTYVAYLFATCAGVSKVGSYTGTATTKQVDCGFTAGSRFVLIKRTDSTGDWYVWDSARGIVSGNDPYLLLNSTAAEVTGTDYVDTYNAGFELSSTAPAGLNANGGTYIFLAIA